MQFLCRKKDKHVKYVVYHNLKSISCPDADDRNNKYVEHGRIIVLLHFGATFKLARSTITAYY